MMRARARARARAWVWVWVCVQVDVVVDLRWVWVEEGDGVLMVAVDLEMGVVRIAGWCALKVDGADLTDGADIAGRWGDGWWWKMKPSLKRETRLVPLGLLVNASAFSYDSGRR